MDPWTTPRSSVDEILQFVCSRSVDIVDIFRLGRFRSDKVRPILVSLERYGTSVCYTVTAINLNIMPRGIFISPDEHLETRRKQTLDRLKYRAERENKQVAVGDDTPHADGVAVYSLANGPFGNNRNARS
jgi:hypothetical protein